MHSRSNAKCAWPLRKDDTLQPMLSAQNSATVALSLYLSVCLSVFLFVYLSICLIASLKTKLFCEASAILELNNVKNETILREVFIFEPDNIQNEAILRDFVNF